eukprot:TRINITY_DN56124_c0_g1_i1.p1 TRINITY_DN56124_c0_g1~~TRINITY_DN56124_c0_g1_i1.p1  ORF type:complete len:359 (-),score=104.72 TRINITY_DN56124_c0_g1_i1:37-1113(-)
MGPDKKVKKKKKALTAPASTPVEESKTEATAPGIVKKKGLKKRSKTVAPAPSASEHLGSVTEQAPQAVKTKKKAKKRQENGETAGSAEIAATDDSAPQSETAGVKKKLKKKSKKNREVGEAAPESKPESAAEKPAADVSAPLAEGTSARLQTSSGEAQPGKWQEDRLTIFVGGMPADVDEEAVRRDFEECGEIERFHMPLRADGKYKGMAFITYATQDAVEKALEYNGDLYHGSTLKVAKCERHSKDGMLKVLIGGLKYGTKADALRQHFEQCGEIVRFDMPLNHAGKCKGVAFATFAHREAAEKALTFNGNEYGGRTLNVQMADNRPPGHAGTGQAGGKGFSKSGKGGKGKGKGKMK